MLRKLRPATILMVFATTSPVAACAPIGRNPPRLLQPAATARHGGVIRGSWEKVEALQRDFPLVVTLKTGDRLEAAFKSIEPAMLVLTNRAGQEFSIPLSTVARVAAQQTADSLTNGAAIGAGIGVGVAVAVLAALGSQDGYVLPSAKVGAPLLLAGAGALLGALVDRAHKSEKVLYLAR
jgi:hypothetical protein